MSQPSKANPIVTDEWLKQRPLSSTSLKEFRKSPKHYIHYITEKKFDKDAFVLGKAFEVYLCDLLFKRDDFLTKFKVYIPAKGTGSQAINKAEKEKAKDLGVTLIKPEVMNHIELMRESLMSVDYIRPYLDGITKTQVKLNWTDRKTKIPFIGYTDFESEVYDTEWSIDLKTGQSADPEKFPRDAYNFGYNIQWATYSEGYWRKFYRRPEFAYLMVESAEPYNTGLFFIEGKTMQQDKEEWRNTVDAFRFCMENEMFHQGYEFLNQAMDYFALRRPGYYKARF